MLKKFSKYIGKYKWFTLCAPLAILCEVILEVLMPKKAGEIINLAQTEGTTNDIIIAAGLTAIALSVGSLLCGAISAYTSSVAGTGFSKNLRDDLFNKVTKFSFANIDKFNTSSLVTRLTTDVNNVQMAFMMLMRVCVRAPFMLICSTIMAFTINAKVAIVFCIAIPVLGGALIFVSLKAFPKFQKMLGKYDEINRDIQENLIGVRAIKAFVREKYETAKFYGTSNDVRDLQVAAESIVALNGPIMQTVVGLTMCGVLFFGGKEIVAGNMESGNLLTLVTYGMQILMSLMMISMILVMIVLSKASLDRISMILDEEIDIKDSEKAIKNNLKVKNGDIEFVNVSFKYNPIFTYDDVMPSIPSFKKKKKKADPIEGFEQAVNKFAKAVEKITTKEGVIKQEAAVENYVLNDINFKIKSGETVGIIGATGSSKSTLISLIPRLYDATKGKVLVGGIDVKDYTLFNLREAVSVVLQKNVLFSGSIRDNLRWGKEDATPNELVEICKIADADNFINEKPDKYYTELGQGGVNVSGGQKQRLTIARALAKDPKILILDDSMSAVDTKTDANIRQRLKQYKPDITKIIIAQRISSISDADKIIVLDNGAISAIGKHDELIKSNDIYREIYESQMNGGK